MKILRITRLRIALSALSLAFALNAAGVAQQTTGVEPASALADDGWHRLRGPGGNGVVEDCSVPIPWSPEQIHWQTELLGSGDSSPVVFGQTAFLMSCDPESAKRYLQAIDLETGQQLWHKQVSGKTTHLHKKNTFASSTPAVDARAVYFTWGDSDVYLAAFTHTGDEIWQRKLGRFVSQHGYGASPVVVGDLVVLFNSQAAERLPPGTKPGTSRIMAFDAQTGADAWTTPTTTTRACYGVPAPFRDANSGKDALLFANTGDGMFALEAATGKMLWNQPALEKRSVSCPVVVGDLGIGSEGSGGGGNIVFGVDLKDPSHRVVFRIQRAAAYVPSPIAYNGLLFSWSDRGIVGCFELPSGKPVWNKRIGGNYSSSPVIVGGKLLGISEDGLVTILAASKNFEKLGEIKLGENTKATPCVGADYLLIRTEKHLTKVGP
ncbi:MAG TPA: serine/threonine protein kinase [Planctomycetaceae bacterium]|nr:serine/threonine protein kinase [Planctomycetaceae bacterium]